MIIKSEYLGDNPRNWEYYFKLESPSHAEFACARLLGPVSEMTNRLGVVVSEGSYVKFSAPLRLKTANEEWIDEIRKFIQNL